MKKQISLAALAVVGLTTFTYAATPLLNLDKVFSANPDKDFDFGYTENQNITVQGFKSAQEGTENTNKNFVITSPFLKDAVDSDAETYTVLLGKNMMRTYLTGDRSDLSEVNFTPKDEDKALGQLTMKLETKDLEKNAYYHGIVVPVDDNVQEGRPSKEFCFNIEKEAFAEGLACETFGVSAAQAVAEPVDAVDATSENDEEHSAAGADMKLADISHTIEGNKIYLSWTALPQSSNVEIKLFNKELNDFRSLGTVPMTQQKFEYIMEDPNATDPYIFAFIPRDSKGREIRYPVNVRHETDVVPDLKPVKEIKVGPVEDMMLILGVTLLLYVGYRVYASRKAE